MRCQPSIHAVLMFLAIDRFLGRSKVRRYAVVGGAERASLFQVLGQAPVGRNNEWSIRLTEPHGEGMPLRCT